MPHLHTELHAYYHHLQGMLAEHEGKYVVIKGDHIAFFTDGYEEALDRGYTQFGLDNFLVKRISQDGDVAQLTRDPALVTKPSP